MSLLSLFSFPFFFLFVYVRAKTSSSPQSLVSSANASGLLFPNTSSTSNSSFSYIIPYGQTQDCDIYGSPCQIGSITVEVNLTTATTTTVLPCSSYISAQYTYLWDQTDFGVPTQGDPNPAVKAGGWQNGDGDPWGTNFGQSPQCRSYAEAMGRGESTFSDCAISNASIQSDGGPPAIDLLQNYPGLARWFVTDDMMDDGTGTCCGNCSLDISEVRLYYFPDQSTIDCHNNQTFNFTHSLIVSESTAVISGHTL